MSSLIEFFGELLSFVPDGAVYRLGGWVLKQCGLSSPNSHGTWCVVIGFLCWLILFGISFTFLVWLF